MNKALLSRALDGLVKVSAGCTLQSLAALSPLPFFSSRLPYVVFFSGPTWLDEDCRGTNPHLLF